MFTFAGFATLWLAYLLVRESVRSGWPLLLLVMFWILVAYLLLPRLHRILTRIYVPGYFIGRARTSNGLLGDPINLGFRGRDAQVHQAMIRAGWSRADDLTFASGLRIIRSTVGRRSYRRAPVSPLLLFDRQQDFAYQMEVAGSPSKRHHVRFWRAPEGWMLPGGYAVDWLAAGTYDRSVGLSLFTFQITHKIEEDTDVERDYVVATLTAAPGVVVDVIRDFSTGYHCRNGGGDLIQTDGDLPVVDACLVDAGVPLEVQHIRRSTRPTQTLFGAILSVLRGSVVLVIGAAVLFGPQVLTGEPSATTDPASLTMATVLLVVFAIGDIVAALAVLSGHNGARVFLMSSSVVAVIAAFLDNAHDATVITLQALPTVGISILILLALSSHRARDFAARPAGQASWWRRRPGRRVSISALRLTCAKRAARPALDGSRDGWPGCQACRRHWTRTSPRRAHLSPSVPRSPGWTCLRP
jgi:hypothetical protein